MFRETTRASSSYALLALWAPATEWLGLPPPHKGPVKAGSISMPCYHHGKYHPWLPLLSTSHRYLMSIAEAYFSQNLTPCANIIMLYLPATPMCVINQNMAFPTEAHPTQINQVPISRALTAVTEVICSTKSRHFKGNLHGTYIPSNHSLFLLFIKHALHNIVQSLRIK